MKTTLIVGSGGGIGKEVARQLSDDHYKNSIFAVSRRHQQELSAPVRQFQIAEYDDINIARYCQGLAETGVHIDQFICCVGLLHDGQLQPEKKIEQLDAAHLQQYFAVNSIIPALWLKHLPVLLDRKKPAQIVFISARVGSISDNRLGGWYGYRASKAALNMLVKTAQVEYRRRFPDTVLVSYHPGTVDTPLSKPFQDRVPEHKLFSPQQAAGFLLEQLQHLDPGHAPYYLDWQGKTIPW
ncbi:SDR family NAD(P)-dependent oxidoreductase [Lacimicrobium alkaliphilum]|uniref:Short-chain dehydrogenase n=1 Tax=Lacimicrobium alkaliphilum TaxID=1526571 RepID=A0A0U3B178_9ALTE|nr:SDR family NAD(P)-dependent oxidoreductase [Lacimicrobium alkaliphilum]ALS97241.1 hypothetical protein AT746_02400 [Lacimicrobium alkaliphilum]